MDFAESFSCVEKIFFKRNAIAVAVTVVAQQHSFCIFKKRDENWRRTAVASHITSRFNKFNQFSVHTRNCICDRRTVLRKVMNKLSFCKIVFFSSVASCRNAKHEPILTVLSADKNPVAAALVTFNFVKVIILQRK